MKSKRLLTVCAALALLLAACTGCKTQEEPEPEPETPRISYAEGVTVVEDPDALQKAVDDMYAQAAEPGISLEYKNDAFSTDGENFECYIANAADNTYDMYIQIFADEALSDELYLSGLLRPGTAFETLTLEHALETGGHRVYVAFTQVEEDLATIHGQIVVTMDFYVT